MPTGYKTVNLSDPLHARLNQIAERVAEKDGISKVSLAQLIERMVKVYETQLEG